LRSLRLRYLDLTDASLAVLSKMTQLEMLDLSSTLISDKGCQQLAALTNLRELYLNHTGISNTGLAALKPLQKLERIELFRTQGSNEGIAALAELKNLSVAKLDYMPLDDKAVPFLQTLPKLPYSCHRERDARPTQRAA
jgi:Leucine-rich repeat (LRR) protein